MTWTVWDPLHHPSWSGCLLDGCSHCSSAIPFVQSSFTWWANLYSVRWKHPKSIGSRCCCAGMFDPPVHTMWTPGSTSMTPLMHHGAGGITSCPATCGPCPCSVAAPPCHYCPPGAPPGMIKRLAAFIWQFFLSCNSTCFFSYFVCSLDMPGLITCKVLLSIKEEIGFWDEDVLSFVIGTSDEEKLTSNDETLDSTNRYTNH